MKTQTNNSKPETIPLFTHETVDGVTFVTFTPPKGKLIEETDIAAAGNGVLELMALPDTGDVFMLEMENVDHLSSASLPMLAVLKKAADRAGRNIMLSRVQPQPMTLLALTKFRIFEIELANAPVEDETPEAAVVAA